MGFIQEILEEDRKKKKGRTNQKHTHTEEKRKSIKDGCHAKKTKRNKKSKERGRGPHNKKKPPSSKVKKPRRTTSSAPKEDRPSREERIPFPPTFGGEIRGGPYYEIRFFRAKSAPPAWRGEISVKERKVSFRLGGRTEKKKRGSGKPKVGQGGRGSELQKKKKRKG